MFPKKTVTLSSEPDKYFQVIFIPGGVEILYSTPLLQLIMLVLGGWSLISKYILLSFSYVIPLSFPAAGCKWEATRARSWWNIAHHFIWRRQGKTHMWCFEKSLVFALHESTLGCSCFRKAKVQTTIATHQLVGCDSCITFTSTPPCTEAKAKKNGWKLPRCN